MKLINTDGMSFIGPGSEWFWTAVSGLVLAITFIAIYRQLRTQHIQIQENAKMLRSQAHFNALSLAQRPWEVLIKNAGLAGVVSIGSATPEALSKVDWLQCSSYMFMQFNSWEYIFYQHRDGSIPKELWIGCDLTFKALIDTKPGYARFWSECEASFDEPFKSYAAQEFAKKSAAPQAA